jgi:DNA-directed RNA polymerase specialized sigma24 family protein
MTTPSCHTGRVAQKKADISAHQETFRRLREVRGEAVRHMRLAQQLHAERRDILRSLIGEGFSQAEIARELGVTRQAIQKMLAG